MVQGSNLVGWGIGRGEIGDWSQSYLYGKHIIFIQYLSLCLLDWRDSSENLQILQPPLVKGDARSLLVKTSRETNLGLD